MKPQFSLATLLLIVTVLAVDLAACKAMKVQETYTDWREPTGLEVVQRFAWSAPLPLAGTYCLIRRLRQPNRSPSGYIADTWAAKGAMTFEAERET